MSSEAFYSHSNVSTPSNRYQSIPFNSVHQIPQFRPINREVPLHNRSCDTGLFITEPLPIDYEASMDEKDVREMLEDIEDDYAELVAEAIQYGEEWPPELRKVTPAEKNAIIENWGPEHKEEVCLLLNCTQNTTRENLDRLDDPSIVISQQEDIAKHEKAVEAINEGWLRWMIAARRNRKVVPATDDGTLHGYPLEECERIAKRG